MLILSCIVEESPQFFPDFVIVMVMVMVTVVILVARMIAVFFVI